MFEQSLVESSGNLRTRASRWMGLAAVFNLSVLALLMLKPLLYPEALAPTVLSATLVAPTPPPAPAPPRTTATPKIATARTVLDPFTAPTRIPKTVGASHEEPPPATSLIGAVAMGSMGGKSGPAGALGLVAAPTPAVVKVIPLPKPGPLHISNGVIAGNKISGSTPVYPPIAKAAHVSGAVVLHAVIAKTGTRASRFCLARRCCVAARWLLYRTGSIGLTCSTGNPPTWTRRLPSTSPSAGNLRREHTHSPCVPATGLVQALLQQVV